jgi:hypothetical protein
MQAQHSPDGLHVGDDHAPIAMTTPPRKCQLNLDTQTPSATVSICPATNHSEHAGSSPGSTAQRCDRGHSTATRLRNHSKTRQSAAALHLVLAADLPWVMSWFGGGAGLMSGVIRWCYPKRT